MRRASSSSYISYELYSNTGRTLRWGNTLNVDRVSATGAGTAQMFTVYGQVPAQTTPAAGTYADTVNVTVTSCSRTSQSSLADDVQATTQGAGEPTLIRAMRRSYRRRPAKKARNTAVRAPGTP